MLPFLTLLAQSDQVETAIKTAEVVAPAGPSGMAMFLVFLKWLSILILPLVIGAVIASFLRMKHLGGRLGWVLLALTLGCYPFVNQMSKGKPIRDLFTLGIDLAGGMNMIFEVDTAAAESEAKKVTPNVMDQMVGAIGRRVNPSGTEEITVRRVGTHKIEVIVPDVDPLSVQAIEDKITKLGSLEFTILANERFHSTLGKEARAMGDDEDDLIKGGRLVAGWRSVALKPDGEPKDIYKFTHGDVIYRDVNRTYESEDGTQKTQKTRQFLVLFEPDNKRVIGRYLVRVDGAQDPNSGGLVVNFTFNQTGGHRFQMLTSKHRPKGDFKHRLGILLDNKLHSAPNLNAIISTSGQIEGNFTQDEINALVDVLNAGALQVPLKSNPRSNIVDPLLGQSVIEKGMTAIKIAGIAVVIFMLIYYLVAGAIANVCLIMNLILVLATMHFIQATFTLPGLAGIVLTIGMAVDANVLIFERIREELHRGSSLRMAIQNGFDRAFTTIVDANLTTLITAVVLFVIGTDQIKGFAVTLFIGIVMSMFTALYFGRMVFEILERKKIIKELKMLRIVKSNTNIDFIGKKNIAKFCSLALIVIGLISLGTRGSENLDIDFTGGSMVSFEFVKEQPLETVREKLEAEFGTAITVEKLSLSEEEKLSGNSKRFRLRTRIQETTNVSKQVHKVFQDQSMALRHITLKDFDIKPFEKDASSTEEEAFALESEITFTTQTEAGEVPREVPLPTMTSYLARELSEMKDDDGALKYGEEDVAASQFELTGLEGSGLEAKRGMTRQYNKFLLKTKGQIEQSDLQTALTTIQQRLDETPFFPEIDTFNSSVAGEMKQQAILAMLISLVAIIGYIWFRFQNITFGFAAVAALVHDVLVVVGMVAAASLLAKSPVGAMLGFTDFKINLPMIAAFLTIIGYSLNDTIVVFDRIREVRGKNPALTEEMVNKSLNQTLSRTLLTSITTFIVVFILYSIGGEGIHGFAFCLVVGVIVGTYSSIYVASPVLLWLMNRPSASPATSRSNRGKTARSAT